MINYRVIGDKIAIIPVSPRRLGHDYFEETRRSFDDFPDSITVMLCGCIV